MDKKSLKDYFDSDMGSQRQPHNFKSQPHKMVKHTETIRRLLPKNCLSVFDHFVGLALKGLSKNNQNFRVSVKTSRQRLAALF